MYAHWYTSCTLYIRAEFVLQRLGLENCFALNRSRVELEIGRVQ